MILALLALVLHPPLAEASPLAAAAAAVAQEPASARIHWLTDVEEARGIAAAEGKHLLIEFGGRGWCTFCERLHREVLDDPAFGAGLLDDFVFVALDFDERLRPRAEGELAAQHGSLREQLEVDGLPEIVLMTPGGVAYDRLGYEALEPEAYEAKLQVARDKAVFLERKVPSIQRAIVSADSPAAALKAADEATTLLRQAGAHALARPLVPLVEAAFAREDLDVEREKAAVAALSAAHVVDDALIDRAFRLDPKNAEGLPEAALAGAFRSLKGHKRVRPLIEKAEQLLSLGPPFDPQLAARLYGDCAFWAENWLDDSDRAAILARYALTLEPKDLKLRSMLEGLSSGR